MIRKRIIAEHPEKALWWRLGQFKNIDTTATLIQKRFPDASVENAKKQARQIRLCLEQAEEYFQSAMVVSNATKPLLLYYGMASLAWALILFKRSGEYALDRVRAEHQGHGLSRPQLDYSDRTLEVSKLLDAIGTTVKSSSGGKELLGTFGLLFSVAEHDPVGLPKIRNLGKFTESSVELAHITNVELGVEQLVGDKLSLGRFLFDLPDMITPFRELGIRSQFAFCSDVKIVMHDENSGKLIIATAGSTEVELAQLETRLKMKKYDGLNFTKINQGVCIEIDLKGDKSAVFPQLSETLDGRHFLYLPESPEQFPESCSLFGAMFLLGMIVRYYPHIWIDLLEKHHPLVQIVEAFLPIAQRKFPNLILNNLAGDSYVFCR